MKRFWLKVAFFLIPYMLVASLTCAFSAGDAQDLMKPKANMGAKWRVGYLESGNYLNYYTEMKAIIKGLVSLGWINDIEFPKETNPDHKAFWEWIADNVKSDYIEFVKDAFWTFDFDIGKKEGITSNILNRLNQDKDINLMIAMGTWAGQALANDRHSVATIVPNASDPVRSGIIKSAEDSGYDHIHAKVDSDRYAKEIGIFHDSVKFTRLGIIYEESEEGRTFAALDIVKQMASRKGFEVLTCQAPFNNVTLEEAESAVVKCSTELAPKVDAVYVTVHRGVNRNSMPNLLAPLLQREIPTFAMTGVDEGVKQGILMSMSDPGFKYLGQYYGEVIAKIFNGVKPRSISQKWSVPSRIALNFETAKIIGYDPPIEVLAAVDEVYDKIEP